MGDVIGPVILGIIISILGISNMKGNISSLHWYHRQRVSPDDVMPFGKRVGLGTLIIGIAIIVFGLFSLITYLTEIEVYTIIGAALLIPAVIVGLGTIMPCANQRCHRPGHQWTCEEKHRRPNPFP